MGRELMAPRTDRTTRIPSGVVFPVTTNHAAKGSVFVNLKARGKGDLLGLRRLLLLLPRVLNLDLEAGKGQPFKLLLFFITLKFYEP